MRKSKIAEALTPTLSDVILISPHTLLIDLYKGDKFVNNIGLE